ncbi:MAG TPA: type 1 glutamine amidotransferase [Deltaproteobacteria bacterium]|nr:type 1 glutamine amidotransferase [Candidatus Binatota bacterium]HIL12871.1 type 1 glutamine amidotransferase [Deltaproteobacteria bacterium]
MRKILVFQHVAHELLGTLNPLLKDSGFRIRYVNFDRDPAARPSLDGYFGLVVLGGPMNVDQVDLYPFLAVEVELVAEALQRGMPVLGICLGAQILARALGADVRPHHSKEIGWYQINPTPAGADDPVFAGMSDTEHIFQWHGDTFDIPSGAVHLASSPDCENQAFRYGDTAYGFQFHLEVDRPMVERWLTVPHNRQEITDLNGAIDPEQIRSDTLQHIDKLQRLSDDTFSRWIKLFGLPRSTVFSSR